MVLNIESKPKKTHMFWVRVEDELYNPVEKLAKKHSVDRSVIVRELIKKGLENENNKSKSN